MYLSLSVVVTFHFARSVAYNIISDLDVDACNLQGVAPRWIALLAVFLLFGSYYVNWLFVRFPLWVLLLSIYILLENVRSPSGYCSRGVIDCGR